jgi:hypothetical protein
MKRTYLLSVAVFPLRQTGGRVLGEASTRMITTACAVLITLNLQDHSFLGELKNWDSGMPGIWPDLDIKENEAIDEVYRRSPAHEGTGNNVGTGRPRTPIGILSRRSDILSQVCLGTRPSASMITASAIHSAGANGGYA